MFKDPNNVKDIERAFEEVISRLQRDGKNGVNTRGETTVAIDALESVRITLIDR